jgi:2-phospho-L-lactate guanylyltransferase
MEVHRRLPAVRTPTAEVLVPVKSFRRAKQRLAGRLSADERTRLARAMATGVVAAAAPSRVSVVCDDEEVAEWARSVGAAVVWTPGLGLNGAVAAGVEHLALRGVDLAVVAHADLPAAISFSEAVSPATDVVSLVPDRRHDGTNVACVPTASGFEWSYGPASFLRHQAEALRLGLDLRIIESADLAWDIDEPDDLVVPPSARLPSALASLFAGEPR